MAGITGVWTVHVYGGCQAAQFGMESQLVTRCQLNSPLAHAHAPSRGGRAVNTKNFGRERPVSYHIKQKGQLDGAYFVLAW